MFASFKFNDKLQSENFSYPLRTTSYPLDLSKVIVITSRSTASASEAVMNGLKPYMDVISVGDTTDGKPTGMYEFDMAQTYSMFPVMFKTVNALGEGDFFGGIAPGKIETDDITHDFSDKKELCLRDAIRYLETNSFSARSLSYKDLTPFTRSVQYSERPSWMNNAFIIEK